VWANLRCKKLQKKAITIFSLKGNVGTAAYLDVFGSIYEVMQALRHNGDVQDFMSSVSPLKSSTMLSPGSGCHCRV